MTAESLFLELDIPIDQDADALMSHVTAAVSNSIDAIIKSNDEQILRLNRDMERLEERVRETMKANECLLAFKERLKP